MGRVAYVWHLAGRFAGSLSPRPASATDERWARGHLGPGEDALWVQLSNPDRRHAITVAQEVVARLGDRADRAVVAAALLHDCGKLDAGFGTFARVAATVWSGVRGHERAAAGGGRVARYLRHDTIGADALVAAGADPLTVAWTREHHLPPASWTLDPAVAAALKAADDD